MNELVIGAIAALWFGILTSISPCPLATNVAAVSYLSKRIVHPRVVLQASLMYVLGRMLAYAIIGFMVVKSIVSIPAISQFLQQYMNKILGPLLIVIGAVLFGLIKIPIKGVTLDAERQEKIAKMELLGPFFLGALFAFSFCPISAGLFFGSLIPLAISHPAGSGFPLIYGVGSGLPVLIFSIGLAMGFKGVSQWFQGLSNAEPLMRKVTGIIFVGVGLYYAWLYLI